MKTRAQSWSLVAFERVTSAKADKTVNSGKYRTSCMKMPGLIHQSGLLQALVFQVARDKDGARYVDDLARAWYHHDARAAGAGHVGLIQAVQAMELGSYLAATRDLADIAQWFRRFAQIELRDVEGDDE